MYNARYVNGHGDKVKSDVSSKLLFNIELGNGKFDFVQKSVYCGVWKNIGANNIYIGTCFCIYNCMLKKYKLTSAHISLEKRSLLNWSIDRSCSI